MSDYDNIRNALNYLDPNDRDFWIRIGAAIKDHQGEEGFTLWDDWSRHSDSYKPSDAKAVWKSLKPGHIRINTLFYHARENGYRPEKPYTPPTAEELAARQAAARARRAEAERQEIQQREKARRTAGYIWTQAAPADPSHPYLKSKGINDPVLLSGIRQNEYKGSLNLVVPVYHEGRLANIQTIGADGGKRFLNGGQVKGGYSVVGSVDDMAKGLVIAEGFATAASIHAATGRPVIVAFNAGNMVAVAEKLAQTLPQDIHVTIAVDNDASQTGIRKAREAAALLGGRVRAVQPEFTMSQIRDYQRGHSGDGTPPLPSDFNDLHLLAGPDAVRQAVEYGHNLAPERPSENPAEPAAPSADPEWEQAVADQRRMNEERRAERAPWRDFPPVIRNGGLGSLKNEPEYAAAKGGNDIEAGRLVNKLLKEETVQQFREMIGDRKPVIVSVSATESAGRNKIPLAMAQALGSRLDLPVDTDIQQINKVSRTGSGIDHRLAFQPVFDGRVEAGRDYLIVDDTLAVGGTVAALRGYIENRGGHVVGAGVMTAHEGALNLPVKQAMIDNISRKHGNTMDNYWKEEFGYGIDQLTQGEAGHLNAARDVEQIRDRIAEARLQGIARPTEQTLPLSPGQQERPDGIAPEPTQAAAPDAAAFSMPAENAKQAEQEKNMAQTADTAAFDGRDFVRSLKSELEQGDFLNNPSFPVFMKADGSYLSARDDYNGLYLFVNAPEGKPVEIEFSSKTHTRNIQIDSYGKSVAEILDELKQSEPTQAAAPDTAAFSMPAANEKQTEQGQNMAQQTDNRPVYSPDNPYAPYAAYDAEVRQNADDWEARVPLTEAMLADFNRQAEQQGYVTHIEARHASLGRFQAEKELDGRAAVIDGEFKNHGGASVYEAPRDFTVTLKQNEEEQDYFYTNSLDAALAHAETYLKERDRPIAENSTQKQAEHTSPAETRTAAPTPEAAVSASTAEQEQNMAQQTQTAVQPERPSENPARITGITLVWSEGSEDKDRRFDNFDQLQQWFEKTYRTADFDRQQGYSKNRIEVSYTRDGQEYSFPFRTDVSWTKGDFNPQREHIADHMAGALEQHGIAPETARAAKQTPQPVQEQNPAKQPGVPSENQSQTAAQTPKSGRSELREKAAKALDTAGDIMDAAALAAGAATGNFVGAAALVAASRVAEHAAGKLMEDMDKQAEKVDAASRRQEQPAPSSATQENGIEYGGSRTQDAARPEPETITVAEVQENLRRIRMAESRAATASEAAPETQARPAREQPSENARGTPVDSGREARADTGRPSENPPAEMQHEERTQPKPVLDLNYETAAGLDARYVRYDGRYLDPNNARTVLFEDKGAKIKTAREDGQTISDMLDTAQAKNWDSIRISGSHEFKRQMWLEAELRGIPNSGYSPSKEDLAMRDQMRETRERNSIEAGGLSRTGEAVQRPSERQSDPERTQTADSPSQEEEPPRGWERVFDDDAPLPSTDTAAVQSAAAEARAAADTPAEYARSEQMQGEANMATVRHNGLHGQAAAANRERQPESAALQSARAVYMQKAEKLSKTAKAQLAFYEKNMNDVFRHLDGPDLERAMTRYYESTAERMNGSHLDMPRPTQIPSPEQKNATAAPAPSVKAGHETDHEIDR